MTDLDRIFENHIAILGKTGSGKSNTAKVFAEKLMKAGERVCIVDPTGTWWGLRLTADGSKPSGLEPVIFGGFHADMEISAEHGEAIGEAIATSSDSAIIDTRTMSVSARTKFFTGFAEALLRANRGALHLIVDEAHLFAPQGRINDPQSGAMLHAANNLVSLGRGIGLRIILISQRPAKLHKDSLTQIETLIAMRLIAPQDTAAVNDWIGEWAGKDQGKQIIAALPGLKTGSAWVWSPGIDLLKEEKFPLASTFDSGKPSAHQIRLEPINLMLINMKLAKVREEAKAKDPKILRAEIERLKRELAAKTSVAGISDDAVKKLAEDNFAAGRKRGFNEGYKVGKNEGGRKAAHNQMMRVVEAMVGAAMINGDTDALADALIRMKNIQFEETAHSDAAPAVMKPYVPPANPLPVRKPDTSPVQPMKHAGTNGTKTEVSLGGERKALAVLVASYPAGYSEAQWATLAGYKRTGGTWGTYKSRLRVAGAIEARNGLWYATEAGCQAVGEDVPELPGTPEERLAMWKSKVPGVGKMLDVLFEAYPAALSRDELAERVSMTPSGGSFGTYLSRLRTNGLLDTGRHGGVRLTSAIMGE